MQDSFELADKYRMPADDHGWHDRADDGQVEWKKPPVNPEDLPAKPWATTGTKGT